MKHSLYHDKIALLFNICHQESAKNTRGIKEVPPKQFKIFVTKVCTCNVEFAVPLGLPAVTDVFYHENQVGFDHLLEKDLNSKLLQSSFAKLQQKYVTSKKK